MIEVILKMIENSQMFIYQVLFSIAVLVLGYFFGRLISILIKFLVKNFLGIDYLFKKKRILINREFSKLLSDLVNLFVYLYFIAYALVVFPNQYVKFVGENLFTFINYLLIIVFSLLISYILLEMFLRSILSEDTLKNKYVNYIVNFIRGFVMYMSLLIVIIYLNIVPQYLLYVLIAILLIVVITISISFAIALSDLLKEKLREIFK